MRHPLSTSGRGSRLEGLLAVAGVNCLVVYGDARVVVVRQSSCYDEFTVTGSADHGCASGVALQSVRCGVLFDVASDFTGDTGGEDVAESGETQVDPTAQIDFPGLGSFGYFSRQLPAQSTAPQAGQHQQRCGRYGIARLPPRRDGQMPRRDTTLSNPDQPQENFRILSPLCRKRLEREASRRADKPILIETTPSKMTSLQPKPPRTLPHVSPCGTSARSVPRRSSHEGR